jgi:hypothetical protein
LFGGVMALLGWSLLLAYAIGAKLRYLLFTANLYRRPISARLIVSLVPLALIDFAVWALPFLDLLNPKRRKQW